MTEGSSVIVVTGRVLSCLLPCLRSLLFLSRVVLLSFFLALSSVLESSCTFLHVPFSLCSCTCEIAYMYVTLPVSCLYLLISILLSLSLSLLFRNLFCQAHPHLHLYLATLNCLQFHVVCGVSFLPLFFFSPPFQGPARR